VPAAVQIEGLQSEVKDHLSEVDEAMVKEIMELQNQKLMPPLKKH
jgi:hypothetical protein